jgi:hypothetical protein
MKLLARLATIAWLGLSPGGGRRRDELASAVRWLRLIETGIERFAPLFYQLYPICSTKP